MTKPIRVTVRISEALMKRISRSGLGKSAFICEAIEAYNPNGGGKSVGEVPIRGREVNDQLLSYLSYWSEADDNWVSSGFTLSRRIRAELKQRLTPSQARRIEIRLKGFSFEQIARKEGCSKQAVEQSISRAYERLTREPDFLELLKLEVRRQTESRKGG